ncbi:NAD(P)-dependent oxidoreductase [Amycolatopsis sp.]|uniref:NAD(P)-dependent oxidoreductase n=1 Tax=Amycolatopsis sp. TaxID=37632 RepID=UPI002CBF935C|nr:NAD(P)-binding domain-containing protein [Amycolatopsis sp.]HVV12643.1 NAD(P)-binding domain-containing protein [Amycolatopsis sp.]
MTTAMTVGFVGAGQTGAPMAERILAAGHRLRLYARRPEVRDRFAGLGAETVDSVASAAAGAEVVVTSLFDDEQLLEVGTELVAHQAEGTVLVSHTTGTPGTIDQLAGLAGPRGVAVLDAPFSGTADVIREGGLTVYLSGSGTAAERATVVLKAYAGKVLRTGGRGSALRMKLLNNLLFAAIAQLTLTGAEAGRAMGVDESAFFEALAVSSGGSTAAAHVGKAGGAQAFAAAVAHFLRKDVAACRAVAAELGVELGPLLRAASDGPISVATD